MQPGATNDELSHISRVWCGRGERDFICRDSTKDAAFVSATSSNLDDRACFAKAQAPVFCRVQEGGAILNSTNDGEHPQLFYWVYSWLVLSDTHSSIPVIRFANLLLISILLALFVWFLPTRHRVILLLLMLCTLSATGFVLFSSLNPFSWVIVGVGFGWLPLHAALSPEINGLRRRGALAGLSVVAWTMAIRSDPRVSGFVLLSAFLVAAHLYLLWNPRDTRRFTRAFSLFSVACVLVIDRLDLLIPLIDGAKDSRSSLTLKLNELAVSFDLNQDFFDSFPGALRPLGTFPSVNAEISGSQLVELPEVVHIGAIVILSFVIVRFFNQKNPIQTIGSGFVMTGVAVFSATQDPATPLAASSSSQPWTLLPLLILAVGWWFLLGPDNILEKSSDVLKPISILVCMCFALTCFTIAERFVDRQTYGLRFLPEGLDQWWWTWMPVGPNVVVVMSPWCLWKFFNELSGFIREQSER